MKNSEIVNFAASTILLNLWGGGLYPDGSDPAKKGWRCRPLSPTHSVKDAWLLGRDGEIGCATFWPGEEGQWAGEIYLRIPQVVKADLEACGVLPLYHGRLHVPDTPGFGLTIIGIIEITIKMTGCPFCPYIGPYADMGDYWPECPECGAT